MSGLNSRAEIADALRGVLLDPAHAASMDVHGSTAAAVLVPVFISDGDLHAVFTKRRSDLRRHAGEISFPGGRADPDDRDLQHTALREAHEEVGLVPDHVEILGALPPVATFVTSYAVYPFVGLIDPGYAWEPSAGEVDTVLELSLPALRDGYARRRILRRGVPFSTDTYAVDLSGENPDVVWGATARMLADLLERVSAFDQLVPPS